MSKSSKETMLNISWYRFTQKHMILIFDGKEIRFEHHKRLQRLPLILRLNGRSSFFVLKKILSPFDLFLTFLYLIHEKRTI